MQTKKKTHMALGIQSGRDKRKKNIGSKKKTVREDLSSHKTAILCKRKREREKRNNVDDDNVRRSTERGVVKLNAFLLHCIRTHIFHTTLSSIINFAIRSLMSFLILEATNYI